MSPVTTERETCPRCGTLLPVHVPEAGCARCAVAGVRGPLDTCGCAAPVRARRYIGTWQCRCCGRLVL
jgi:hypothetical protein